MCAPFHHQTSSFIICRSPSPLPTHLISFGSLSLKLLPKAVHINTEEVLVENSLLEMSWAAEVRATF